MKTIACGMLKKGNLIFDELPTVKVGGGVVFPIRKKDRDNQPVWRLDPGWDKAPFIWFRWTEEKRRSANYFRCHPEDRGESLPELWENAFLVGDRTRIIVKGMPFISMPLADVQIRVSVLLNEHHIGEGSHWGLESEGAEWIKPPVMLHELEDPVYQGFRCHTDMGRWADTVLIQLLPVGKPHPCFTLAGGKGYKHGGPAKEIRWPVIPQQ